MLLRGAVAIAGLCILMAALVVVDVAPSSSTGIASVFNVLWVFHRLATPALSTSPIHPNELAGVLAVIVPATLGFGLYSLIELPATQRYEPRLFVAYFSIAAGFLGLLGLWLTHSRSAFFGTSFSIALLLLLALKSTRRPWLSSVRLLAMLLVVAGVGVTVWFTAIVLPSLEASTKASSSETFQSRLNLWQTSLVMVEDFPITGVGPGQFDSAYQMMYALIPAPPGEVVPHAHNQLLDTAVELGIPGAIAWCALMIMCLLTSLRASRSDDAAVRSTAVGVGVSIVSANLYGLADAIALGARGGFAIWIVIGVIGALARANRPMSSRSQANADEKLVAPSFCARVGRVAISDRHVPGGAD
jgi:putative inorganic carbon (HCO3(-)) transporter